MTRPFVTAAVAPAAATPILFADRGCPFAHRVLALLDHLGAPVERRESAVGAKPPGIERYSEAKRIPLLVHGELVLTESRVIAEHLTDYYGFPDAYPDDITARSLHRHAMALVERTIVPVLFGRAHVSVDDSDLGDTLRTLAAATATVKPRPSMLSLHVAPMWQRTLWWHPDGAVVQATNAHPALRAWLDATLELACVARTAPDRDTNLQDLARARDAGMLGPSTV